MTAEYLFVYGTLRPECQQHSQHLPKGGNIAHKALQVYGKAMGQCIWQAQLFDLGSYPGAKASSKPRDQVIGELFCLKNPQAALTILDEYEACRAEDPSPHEYERCEIQVYMRPNTPPCTDQTKLWPNKVWVYEYRLSTIDHLRIPTGDYTSVYPPINNNKLY
jgi:gamma-glutamylcyclotransferase (GGCT)/AIG2-like uncharacterized protein YtfP